ncbi:MAG TPA: serine/threonine-protein kinase [Gemmatimonadales bacterium]|nr:serine/threonine-protein kinase [Gemmatimonadales bacterium]
MATLDQLQAALAERYKVEREIGAGGMATVYRAEDLKHHRAVAIKLLRPELAASLGTDRFLREIELAARLQHPHILPLYDSGSAGGFLYYVMPFVEGESLRDLLNRETSLPVETAVQLTREVASALAYAHSHGVVHRDIKPENILISGGHAVVADFGIARAVDAASGGERLTGVGLSIGTPAYMSPEQATASDEVDGRSDIYSLGSVLFETLSGQPAFSGPNVQSVITKSISGPRPHVRTLQKQVPEAIDQVVTRSLAQDPAQRYQTAAEFSDSLGRALMGEMTGGRRKWLPVAAGILTAVLLIAGFLGYRAWAERSPVRKGAELIAVLPFSTAGAGVDLLGEGMVDLLSTNLNAVGGITTVDPRTVLSRWHRDSGSRDAENALKVGRDLEAGSVLTGSVVAAGEDVRINAELTSVTGQSLARAQVNGKANNVIALVDSLSLALLRSIWTANEPIPSLRVGAITSNSVDAIRAYMQGEQFYRQAKWDSAIAAFTRAVEADSTFALANFRLALSIGWTGGWQAPNSIKATEAAYRYLNRLPERDRALISGYRLFTQGKVEAVDSFRHYVAQYPKDVDGWFMLGDAQYHMRDLLPTDPRAARAPFDSVIKRDPSLVAAYFHPMELSAMERDSVAFNGYLGGLDSVADSNEVQDYEHMGAAVWGAGADSALLEMVKHHLSGATFAALFSRLSDEKPDADGFVRGMAGISAAQPPGSPGVAQWLSFRIATLVSLGRLAESARLADSLLVVNPQMGRGMNLLPVQVGIRPPPNPAMSPQMKAALEAAAPQNYFPASFALAYLISAGETTEARHILDLVMAPSNTNFTPQQRALMGAYRGWMKVVAGDTAGGVSEMKAGLRASGIQAYDFQTSHLRFRLAEILAARPATRAEGIALLRYGFKSGSDMLYTSVASLALGRALEAQGDRPGAAAAYSHFLKLWTKADSTVQSLTDEAREGLKRTTGEPAS